jgi:hypothetical protein
VRPDCRDNVDASIVIEEEQQTMKRQKLAARILLSLIVISLGAAACGETGGTTIVVAGTPPPQVTISPLQTITCLGEALNNFSDIGTSGNDDHIVVKVAWATLETLFASSCRKIEGPALTLIQRKVDATTYLYVDSGTTPTDVPSISLPIFIANCTTSPESSDFYLGTPYWVSVADPDTGTDAIYQHADFPNTTTGIVASYLNGEHLLTFTAFFDKKYYTLDGNPTLEPDGYIEIDFLNIITTYVSGKYAVYSGGQVTKGPAQWSYVSNMAFPDKFNTVLHSSGAAARGLCTPA